MVTPENGSPTTNPTELWGKAGPIPALEAPHRAERNPGLEVHDAIEQANPSVEFWGGGGTKLKTTKLPEGQKRPTGADADALVQQSQDRAGARADDNSDQKEAERLQRELNRAARKKAAEDRIARVRAAENAHERAVQNTIDNATK